MKGFTKYGALLGLALLLAGCSGSVPRGSSYASETGTAWGNDVHSSVRGVSAERVRSEPSDMVVISYSANYQPGYDKVYSIRNGDLEYAVRDANFNAIPMTRNHSATRGQWQYTIPARVGMNYQLWVRNHSYETRYEIVATVDGLDVISGKPGSLRNHGYILNGGSSLAIKGFRKDSNTEAAFRFSDARDAYAANSAYGSANNIGVIGLAAFELQGPATSSLPPCASQAFPADNSGYAPPPCRK